MSFKTAQAEYEAMMPKENPLLAGKVEIYLTEGIYGGQEVTVDVELSPADVLTIYEATLIETDEEIHSDEITSKDRDRIADKLIELKELESDI